MQNLVTAARDWAAKYLTSAPKAMAALRRLESEIDSSATYENIRRIEKQAEAAKAFWRDIEPIRKQCERVILLAKIRVGRELKPVKTKGNQWSIRAEDEPTQAAQLGVSQPAASRIKALADLGKDRVIEIAEELWNKGKEATQTAVLKLANAKQTEERRETSRSAAPIANGAELRIGDCREVLGNIDDNSVPLILTDPPYGDDAEPLYQWLAEFAQRVLIPGGSLICYTGQSRLDRDMAIFSERLRYWWLLTMPHKMPQRLPGKFVIASYKPILWYVKEFRRGRTLVADKLPDSPRDKTKHEWGQGEAGVSSLIEDLTDPAELIVDPFAGSAMWGNIAIEMGRRWIGSDILRGGTETILTAAE